MVLGSLAFVITVCCAFWSFMRSKVLLSYDYASKFLTGDEFLSGSSSGGEVSLRQQGAY